jgi:hypothetical protein
LEKISMKKTLIALATVAVTSTAMAQVTMSGAMAYRFESSVSKTGAQDKGVGVNDAYITFATSEDLGGGLKLSASSGIDLGSTEDKATIGQGVNISLSTANMGSVTFSSDAASDYLPIDFMAETVGGHNGSSADRIIYKSPSIAGANISFVYADDTGNTTSDAAGAHGVNDTSLTTIVDYSIGALTASAQSTSLSDLNSLVKKARGYKAKYDFGVAAVSYGNYKSTSAADVITTETSLQVTAPVGPIALSVVLGSQQIGATATKLKGNQITATYALSKRTNVALDLVKYDSATAGVSPARSRMTLAHSF